jgi:hypothetical protein
LRIEFDHSRLAGLARDQAAAYRMAQPFPHLVVDDFLPTDVARAVSAAFPGPADDVGWDHYAAQGFEMKIASSDRGRLPDPVVSLIDALNSPGFLVHLEALTGISGLIADPSWLGGGVHLVGRGGHLAVHADFNWHESLQAHRRINLLLYFNEDWRQEYGGDLELWSTDASRMVRSIAPLFNRAVLFNARSDTFHGHPAPLQVPEGSHRRSLALYYYSRQPLEGDQPVHGTRYKGLHLD